MGLSACASSRPATAILTYSGRALPEALPASRADEFREDDSTVQVQMGRPVEAATAGDQTQRGPTGVAVDAHRGKGILRVHPHIGDAELRCPLVPASDVDQVA